MKLRWFKIHIKYSSFSLSHSHVLSAQQTHLTILLHWFVLRTVNTVVINDYFKTNRICLQTKLGIQYS